MTMQFPNESSDYRDARNALVEAERELRAATERVASLRRELPEGGEVPTDYVFEEVVDGERRTVKLSDLFSNGNSTLFVYGFMFSPAMESPCPMCTAMLDGLNGQVPHLEARIATAVVARHDAQTLADYAADRGWSNLRMLSAADNDFPTDYGSEVDGGQMPMAYVFEKDGDTIRHFWSPELFFQPPMEGTNPRHLDAIWPLWNVLDLTRQGRGDWYPSLIGRA